ncbi:hypothetical protein [Paenibacillus vini]|uniref:DUF4352 domain-containing protein n=1 Tax=Paenibacillus vini TaxID=1476024 RepID=A0ABQ4M6G1_9BACL|nr:hypothetical protein [Paenibacillus vini]GIP51584.1 hypothetical protein J42TS3_06190 [Paenibacillus vini]
MNKKSYTGALLGLAILMASSQAAIASSSTGNSALAANAAKSTTKKSTQIPVVHTLANLKPVKITVKSTVQLSDVNILTQDEGNILTYTLTIKNGDSKTLDLIDYWSKVRTASGSKYSTTLMTKDKEKKKLSPGSSTTLTYVTSIGKNVKYSDLIFEVVKWDFSQTNYEALKGNFKIPATYTISTPVGYSKTLRFLDNPVKLKVDSLSAYKSGNYNYVSLAVRVNNIGYKLFEDPKVKYVFKTSNGASYPLTASSASQGYQVQPQDSKLLLFMTAIPQSINLAKAELQVVQEDETSKQNLPIATLQLPNVANHSMAVEAYGDKEIQLQNNGVVTASVRGTNISQTEGDRDLTIQLQLINTGSKTVTLPKYEPVLHTDSGYELPITTLAFDSLTMKPMEERNLRFSVMLPAHVDASAYQLFLNIPAGEEEAAATSFKFPAGVFKLPEPKESVGTTQYVQTKNGLLGVAMDSIQRLPWSDGQIISTRISLSNSGIKTLPLPALTGEYKVDSIPLGGETELVSTQSINLLGAGKSTDVYVVSKLPSDLDITDLQVSLLEKIGESSSEWIQFAGKKDGSNDVKLIKRGESYTAGSSGRQAEVSERRSFVYPGVSSDLVYTELIATNLEDRQTDLSQLTAFYQGTEGQTYKASVKQIETSAGPDEKSIVFVWAKVPKKAAAGELKLMVGESITDNKFTSIKGEPTGFVNAASLDLTISTPTARGTLTDMLLFPYVLTVKDVVANLDGSSSVHVTFEYNLDRDYDYTMGEYSHKFLFELVDPSGRKFEKEFAPETDLKVGKGGNSSFSFSDSIFEDKRSGNYTLNIYDLFEGHRVKIGSQAFYYSTS